MPSDVGSASIGLVSAAPGGPVEAVGDGVLAAMDEVEESADFGEAEVDQAPVNG